jgi:tetratricopeptide (TPR) repeat protein
MVANLRGVKISPQSTAALCCAFLVIGSGCRMVSQGRNVDGVRYFQQGQYPVALQRFDAALTIDPRNADTYYNKAAVYHRMGLANRDQSVLTQAESLYNQCLDINPNHVDCHRGLAVLLVETGRTDKAFALLINWAARSPQNADTRVELARLYEESGNARSAEIALNEALALDMRNWRAHAALGRLKEQAGDYPQALQNYQLAYSINRFQP